MALILLSWGLFTLFVIIAIIYLLWSKNHRNCLFISGFFVIMGFITRFTMSTILSPIYTSSELMTATQTMVTSYFIIALVFAVWAIYLLVYRHLEEKTEEQASNIVDKLFKKRENEMFSRDKKKAREFAKDKYDSLECYKKIFMKKMGLINKI